MNEFTIIPSTVHYDQRKPIGWPGHHRSPEEIAAEHHGMGFIAVAAPAVAAGPPGLIVAGVVGAVAGIAKLFGFGGDDQKTNFRPPSNTPDLKVQLGNALVSFDMNDLRLANARGNRTDDLYSYYSAFISGSTSAGASKAARKVIEDAARKYGLSIAQAAATILETAGVRKIVTPIQQPAPPPPPAPAPAPMQSQSFLATKPAPTELPKTPTLISIADAIAEALSKLVKPPALPAATATRPGDIDNAPPPAPPPAQMQTQNQQGQGRTPGQIARDLALQKAIQLGERKLVELLRRQQQVANQAAAFGCNPDAQFYDTRTGQCLALAACPQDQYFDPTAAQCLTPGAGDLSSFLDSLGKIGGIPVWLLLLAAGVVVLSSDGGGRSVTFRRKR